ncbi:MAG TPA: UDP-N-acetylmuramoyl-L-alanine--D-glutamate ligase [Gemmatimonadales bacterium]
MPAGWRRGEVAVVGLARSGAAATRWLAKEGVAVYASDRGDSPALRRTAAELAGPGVTVTLGSHDLERIGRAVAVIVSPGVPPDAPPMLAARARGVPVLAELDLGVQALDGVRVVGVTGTNGKTTTTALIAHLLEAAGIRAAAAGNIGRPLIQLAALPDPPAWAAVEVSSFQLHDAPHLAPAIGVITNLAPNHLDRYATLAVYYAEKRLLFRNARADSVWVLNGDDAAVLELAAGAKGRVVRFGGRGRHDAWWDRSGGTLMLGADRLLERARLPLLGDHNVENALAAALAARAAGADTGAIATGLASFRGLPHRLELVGEVRGVRWFNDSKATNVASAAVGLKAMDRPYEWIAGGRHKGEPYAPLVPLLQERCKAAVVLGEAAELIAHDVGGAVTVERSRDLADAVARAARLTEAGDAVLLSPACSSYDMFTNYEERGAVFRQLVGDLPR